MIGWNKNDLSMKFSTINAQEMSEHSAIGLYIKTKVMSNKV